MAMTDKLQSDQGMVLGVFQDEAKAEAAIRALEANGVPVKDISIVMKDADRASELKEDTGAEVADGVAGGVAAGALVGGIAGLLVGLGALTIPGIGAVLIGGPLAAAMGLTGAAATTATGALTGAVTGGLVGGLVGLGVSEEDARYYQSRVVAGAILLAAAAQSGTVDSTAEIMDQHGAEQVRTVRPPVVQPA